MQGSDHTVEKAELEIQLAHYEKLLDQSIATNEEFAKTKAIFHELKKIRDRLEEIKKA